MPVERIVGMFGVLGVNENGKILVYLCAERDLIGGTCFLRRGKSISTLGWVKLMGKRHL